ncbi:alpha/beta fold hydrolase [Spiractinospora alimapuensis]|uniref:alpha/beta fold hydrolase n=1 Tax=Spiractinospora alimapuensis TaxID=2820884 RepID=UPI001F2E9192|nr:alpha/beta fold hydrolase [Spiractinospora alimapuensis]QVQ50069.1 alpha/beta fold hydrolase [Spiractinospora alimapuensis]
MTEEAKRERLIPPGAEELFVDVQTGRVRVLRSTGDHPAATPLLLVHGGGTDNAAISWYRLFDALGSGRAVYAVDLPGFGYTEIDPVGGPDAQADFVAGVAEALGLDRAIVAGVSMGGDVALNLALRHAERVAGLVLIGPGGLIPLLRNRWTHTAAWMMSVLPDWAMDPLARLANRYVDAVIRTMVKDVDTLPPEVRREFVEEARRRSTSMGYRRYNQATLGRRGMLNNLLPVVGSIEVPTLFFHGEDDPLVDPRGSREATNRMPHATLAMVPNCGHWAQLEAHDRFLRELDQFTDEWSL